MAKYNGHRSWAAWNVALWIGNDEPLYRLALECLKAARQKKRPNPALSAARIMSRYVPRYTPDGARFTITSMYEAIQGLEE